MPIFCSIRRLRATAPSMTSPAVFGSSWSKERTEVTFESRSTCTKPSVELRFRRAATSTSRPQLVRWFTCTEPSTSEPFEALASRQGARDFSTDATSLRCLSEQRLATISWRCGAAVEGPLVLAAISVMLLEGFQLPLHLLSKPGKKKMVYSRLPASDTRSCARSLVPNGTRRAGAKAFSLDSDEKMDSKQLPKALVTCVRASDETTGTFRRTWPCPCALLGAFTSLQQDGEDVRIEVLQYAQGPSDLAKVLRKGAKEELHAAPLV